MALHDVPLLEGQISVAHLVEKLSPNDAETLLHLAISDQFAQEIALVSSFGADSVVLLHMVAQIEPTIPIIFVDTQQLFPETLAYRDLLKAKLGLSNILNVYPDRQSLAQNDAENFLWSSDPDRCCEIRKIEPLEQALQPFKAWITGRKRFQSSTRTKISFFEAEAGRVKINPLAHWTGSMILDYIRQHDLPPHPLVAKGYPSIGCLPCTSPVHLGEDQRAGRWRGRGKIECGIHGASRKTRSDM